jgi:hypothetical protein
VPREKSSPSRTVRAVTSAVRFAIDPPDVRTPPADAGRPMMSQNQRTTVFSICAQPGAAPQYPT